jgi:hypothetical protein
MRVELWWVDNRVAVSSDIVKLYLWRMGIIYCLWEYLSTFVC